MGNAPRIHTSRYLENTTCPVVCLDCDWAIDNTGSAARDVLRMARQHVAENPTHTCHVEQAVAIYVKAADNG